MINKLLKRKPDPINNPVAKATTPDRLIAAAIIESLGKEFNDWKASNLGKGWTNESSYYTPERTLKNEKKNLCVSWESSKKDKDSYGTKVYKLAPESATVNGIKLDAISSRLIIEAYDRIEVVESRAAAVAAKALAAMKANEAKWEMAEKLLGMKRNKMGALVPANPIKEDAKA